MDTKPLTEDQAAGAERHEKAILDRCKELVEAGSAVEAVKLYRATTGCGLPTAQRALGLRL